MSDQVPYQAYKSKRHSHNPSNSRLVSSLHHQELASSPSTPTGSGSDTAPAASSLAGPSSPQPDQVKSSLNASVKRASTFRRVPRSNAHTPSPLGPNQKSPTHSPSVSLSPSALGVSDSNNVTTRPPPPSAEPQILMISNAADSVESSSPSFITAGNSFQERRRSVVSLPPSSQLALQKIDSGNVASINRSSPESANGSPQPPKPVPQYSQAPYRPGFQPKGVVRLLTDDFLMLRHVKREGGSLDGCGVGMKRVERTKLTRRLEKLIDLHFPRSSLNHSLSGRRPGLRPISGSETHRRASSLFDFDIKNVNISDPGGLLRGFIGSSEVSIIRAAEQRITPWQDDADVAKCPLCFAAFHPLTNRKHHCRLCGQIVCSLPVKGPHRPALCSLLFIVNPITRRIEEVNEGVDYGVRKRAGNNGSPNPVKGTNMDEDKFLKGVRICRMCRPILLMQQYQQDVVHVPTISKLYKTLIELEKEIEESLPQFQELILSLSQNDQPTKQAGAARKRLVEAFTEYDSLSKQIRKLPCTSGPGGSQERVQAAILARANAFLQKNMFPLQSLPVPKKELSQIPKTSQQISEPGHHIDTDSKIALALQPLLEQEALLETFVEEAKAYRKFEDVKTLKANLAEIRTEIERIIANRENGLL